MELETYRLVVTIDGREYIGRIVYSTLQEAEQRIERLVQIGYQRENIRIITESELYN